MSVIRGTTPTLEFILPFDTATLHKAYVTIAQDNQVIIDKPITECECEGDKLSVRLTQEETLKLDCKHIAEVQLVVKTLAGDVIPSQIISFSVGRMLRDGVI